MLALLVHLDRWLRLWVVTHRLDALNPVMWAVSAVGRSGMVWLAVGSALTIARRIRPAELMQLTLAILLASLLTNQFLKPLIGRDRPFVGAPEIQVIGRAPHDASFPSGHSANALAGAYVLTQAMPAGRLVWWAMALLISYSRIYLGVHYPLDVIGGAIVGLSCGIVVTVIAARSTQKR